MIANEETDRRIRKKVFAGLLDNICRVHNYYIFTKCMYDPVKHKIYYSIKAMNRSRFRTAEISDFSGDRAFDRALGDDYIASVFCGRIYYAIDEWDYIRILYACALSCQDEATVNDIEHVFNTFGTEIHKDDILADIDGMIERYTSPELANGELVAWLLEFKKNRFGFENEEELL